MVLLLLHGIAAYGRVNYWYRRARVNPGNWKVRSRGRLVMISLTTDTRALAEGWGWVFSGTRDWGWSFGGAKYWGWSFFGTKESQIGLIHRFLKGSIFIVDVIVDVLFEVRLDVGIWMVESWRVEGLRLEALCDWGVQVGLVLRLRRVLRRRVDGDGRLETVRGGSGRVDLVNKIVLVRGLLEEDRQVGAVEAGPGSRGMVDDPMMEDGAESISTGEECH